VVICSSTAHVYTCIMTWYKAETVEKSEYEISINNLISPESVWSDV